MDVQLYVYDLTQGMARAMSRQLLGTQIDAVYHTALVFDSIEYFFGAGVQTCYAGQTHHGKPMEILEMGTTHLPMETILEYLESLKQVYTPESYDLFAHNCNNFSNDFCMFLVGKGIPEHITSLPRKVLDTPFGQMLRPQIDASMRSITQAPVPASNRPLQNSSQSALAGPSKPAQDQDRIGHAAGRFGKVVNAYTLEELQKSIEDSAQTCLTIFFTSSTCAPCKIAYPTFDDLAAEHANALFVKVDINYARDVASQYQIRATPTFMSFSNGAKQDEWTGADPSLLRSNVKRVIETAFPPHPHTKVHAPQFSSGSLRPVTYVKVPPLEKLLAKLGKAGDQKHVVALHAFIAKRSVSPMDAPLPDLQSVSNSYATEVIALPADVRFAAVDLLRCAMIDPRVSGYFAEEPSHSTILALINHVNELDDCPHNLRLVTLHLACNIFTSSLFVKELMQADSDLLPNIVHLIATSLIDVSHSTTRVASASLAFNLSTANYRIRREEAQEALNDSEQVELAASLLEVVSTEESDDALRAILLALGYLVYHSPRDGELHDLCQVMDAKAILGRCTRQKDLAKEVTSLL